MVMGTSCGELSASNAAIVPYCPEQDCQFGRTLTSRRAGSKPRPPTGVSTSLEKRPLAKRNAMTNDDARIAFESAASQTRERSPATFDKWFGGIQFDDLTEGVLTLRAQNEFVLEWVKTNFLPDLLERIHDGTGWSV
jgi:hypothetical protein